MPIKCQLKSKIGWLKFCDMMSWIYETNYSELETVAKRMSVQATKQNINQKTCHVTLR